MGRKIVPALAPSKKVHAFKLALAFWAWTREKKQRGRGSGPLSIVFFGPARSSLPFRFLIGSGQGGGEAL